MQSTGTHTRLATLTGWRGIIAVFMVMFHMPVEVFNPIQGFVLSSFFVMSGFLLCLRHPAAGLRQRSQWRRFMAQRAVRFYPVHWVATAVALLAMWVSSNYEFYHLPALVPNLLLVHIFIPVRAYLMSFNPLCWFLGTLLCLYAVYPWVAPAISRLRLRSQWLLVAVWIAALLALSLALPQWRALGLFHVSPLSRLADFAAGIVCYNTWQQLRLRKPLVSGWVPVTAAVALVGVLWALVWHWDWSEKSAADDFLMWIVPAMLLLLALVLNQGCEGPVGSVLRWRPVQLLGELSLEIFLLHTSAAALCSFTVSPLLAHFGWVGAYDWFPLTVWLLLLPMAWLMHRCITVPLGRWAKSRLA